MSSSLLKPRLVKRSASQLPRRSPQDLARLDAAMRAPIDTTDIPELTFHPARRIRRDKTGRLPRKPPSPIRDAILAELGRQQMTRYELWKTARRFCKSLPQSAVYEFLRGQRQIGLTYIEALFKALGLHIAKAA